MTTIVYSVLSFLILIMGVVTFNHGENLINIPDDISDEIRENSLFPARHIRPAEEDPFCHCNSKSRQMDFGEAHYPRHLVSNNCVNQECVDRGICKEILYNINVSSFRNSDIYSTGYLPRIRMICLDEWKNEEKKISVSCERVRECFKRN